MGLNRSAWELRMKVTVVVGNPKRGSRTRAAAELVAQRLSGKPADDVIELAELGAALLDWGSPQVDRAKQIVLTSGLVIFASPTFKASYTGLLKLFLEQFGAGELAHTIGVPLMLGGAPHHALAADILLKPVLVD